MKNQMKLFTPMVLAVTGHRPDKLNYEYDLNGPWSKHIREKLQETINDLKPTRMLSGMALGVDTIWAMLAIENNIPLIAIVPFPEQDKIWRPESVRLYKELLSKAHDIKITGTPGYAAWKMNVRNEYMVNKCDLLIAVYNGDQKGGTYNCIKYAESISKPILKINPKPQFDEIESKSNEIGLDAIPGLWDIAKEQERDPELPDSKSS